MDIIQISRFICLVLRHKPEAAGITVDAHGWVDVQALIEGVRRRYPLTRELLEEIVRTDDKQRYAFSEDGTRIRANQGHSIPVDVELTELLPPQTLWHGTGEKYVAAIEAEGLRAKSRLYVHLSADRQTAHAVGSRHGTPVIFRIQAQRMAEDGYRFFRSANGVWLTQEIPARYLEREP